jgi:hypothetical protein
VTQAEQNLDAIADSLGSLVQRAAESGNAANDQASRARLLRRAQTETNRVPRRPTWHVGLPALAVAAALLVWWLIPSALRYEVSGAEKDGAYISAPSNHTVSVRFSDETLVQVEPASQLRVEDTSRRGARVLLERGTADVHVVHQAQTHWTFLAGPFEVLVTGTRFDLSWDPALEVLVLRLREGSVEIQTPFGAAPVGLRGGQTFRADLRQRSMTTTDATPEVSPSSAPLGAPSAGVPAAQDATLSATEADTEASSNPPTPVLSNAPASNAPPSRSWSKLVAAGDFKTVLSQATERGVATCLRGCNASDLSALADAARYTGRTDLAEQSLGALRARFTRDAEGRNAAFLLGRLSEAQGAASEARTWYQRYLNEAPGGPYAAEALAGKMRTTLKLQGQTAAEPIAEDYLRRYPAGVQANTARGILGSH